MNFLRDAAPDRGVGAKALSGDAVKVLDRMPSTVRGVTNPSFSKRP